ncbi:MAG: hypothetical protein WA055_01425 [Candidatus Moraniibacteriota bacterium]
MKISRELAIKILKYLDENPDFYFPFLVMCKEYSDEDDDFVEIEADEWENIEEDEKYQTFELWENLQNLDEETLKLMSKGFLEKITNIKAIKNFIFYTTEGYTFYPGSEDNFPEVENCQILGWGKGNDVKEAFDNFTQKNKWLKESLFDNVIGAELKDEKSIILI